MEINKNKTTSVLPLGKVDIRKIEDKIKQLSEADWDTEEDFNANYNKNSKSVLNSTKHIIFKFSNKQSHPFTYHNYSRWKEWKATLLPVLKESTKNYRYNKGVFTRVMLAKLPPKSFIAPHRDGNETGSIPHKIHIPIVTNKQSFFFVRDEKFHFEVGKAYEVNNAVKHSVVNSGNSDRIHLIFEYLDYDAQSNLIQNQINLLTNE